MSRFRNHAVGGFYGTETDYDDTVWACSGFPHCDARRDPVPIYSPQRRCGNGHFMTHRIGAKAWAAHLEENR